MVRNDRQSMEAGNNRRSDVILALSVVTVSSIISLYVYYVARTNLKPADTDPLERGALTAAAALANITTRDPILGNLALQKRTGDNPARSVRTVRNQIEAAAALARAYGLTRMSGECQADLELLARLQDGLEEKAARSLSTGEIYQSVRNIITRGIKKNTLTNLVITLGHARKHGEVDKPTALDEDDFTALRTAGQRTAPAVSIEVTTGGEDKRVRRVVMALPSLERDDDAPQSLVLAFPHGRVNELDSLAALFSHQNWKEKGDWQMCVGNIPGGGHLAPTAGPITTSMTPRESLAEVYYHFVRDLSSPVSAERLIAVSRELFPALPAHQAPARLDVASSRPAIQRSRANEEEDFERLVTAGEDPVSALVQESDARQFAFLYKGGASEQGTTTLARVFRADSGSDFPASALPVAIDTTGSAYLNQSGFDRGLALGLLSAIYDTNLAATDTLATAQVMQGSAVHALKEIRDRLYLENSDLNYLRGKLARLKIEKRDDRESKRLESEIAGRQTRLELDQRQEKLYVNVIFLAQKARLNAYGAASKSFMCGSQLNKIAASGVEKLENGYLLGRRFVFLPHTSSLSETEIFDRAQELTQNADAPLDSPWLQKLTVFGTTKAVLAKPDTQIKVSGQFLSDLRAQQDARSIKPATLVLDSRALSGGSTGPSYMYFERYPLSDLRLSTGSQVFYCQDALETGKPECRVVWSVLARDYATRQTQRTTLDSGWCRRAANWSDFKDAPEICPTPTGEWQLRAPLVNADQEMQKVLKGATLTNPENGQRVPQVPPASVDLM